MSVEVWKTIPSLPTHEASSWGRLRSLRLMTASYGHWSKRDGRFVTNNRKTNRNYKIARLVCEAFHGPPPDARSVAMHLDEDSRNNRPENLAWGTQKENLNAPGFLAYCRSRTGGNNPRTKGRQKRSE
jgi:hypothetical protein